MRCALPILTAAVLLTAAPVRADLLTNGNFELEPNFTSGDYIALTGNAIPGWTIASDHHATVHRTGSPSTPTISGTFSVNTDGEGNNALMYQDFASALGTQYQLAFDWEGWATNPNIHLRVSLTDTTTNDTLFNGLYTSDGLLTPHHITANFAGTGNTLRLQVENSPQSGYNDNLFVVDNFSVNEAATPEPGTLALLGMAGVTFAGVRLRRPTATV